MEPIEPIITIENGVEYCDEERALAVLLNGGVLFCNERHTTFQGEPDGSTVVLYVNCNDVFAWGCADAEHFSTDEIKTLYKAHIADPVWGAAKWCCIKRNQKPQGPVEKAMREAGSWDEAMEKLPKNTQDREVHDYMSWFASEEKKKREKK